MNVFADQTQAEINDQLISQQKIEHERELDELKLLKELKAKYESK